MSEGMKRENIQVVADELGITYDDAKNSAILYGEVLDWYIHEYMDGNNPRISEIVKCIETRKTMSAVSKVWTSYKIAVALQEMMPLIISVPEVSEAARTKSFKTRFEADA